MNGDELLYSVSRIANGWLVRHTTGYGSHNVEFCPRWEDVESLSKQVAFPYPNKTEPRGPKP